MKDIIETSKYKLSSISKNRYEIEIKTGLFSKNESRKISGCYFSGPQKNWVFPKNEISLKQFESLFKNETQTKIDNNITAKKNDEIDTIDNEIIEDKNTVDKNNDSIFFKSKTYIDYINVLKEKKYSKPTIETYIGHFKRFLKFYGFKHPKSITDNEIREYLLYLVKEKKLSATTQNHTINSLKFYYSNILARKIDAFYIQRPKMIKYKPSVLSKNEVVKILKSVTNLKHQIILYIIYSSGLIPSEIIHLKIIDIDSTNRTIYINHTNKFKKRFVILSDIVLKLLREYYREYKPKMWLFEGASGGQYSKRSIHHIFTKALKLSKIKSYATLKTLKNSFAVHLLESGTDIRYVQKLLGHKNLKSTQRYKDVSKSAENEIISPLDKLFDKENL